MKGHLGFIADLHQAAEKGITESVSFLIAMDKKLLEKEEIYI
jgi:hypothetical protein